MKKIILPLLLLLIVLFFSYPTLMRQNPILTKVAAAPPVASFAALPQRRDFSANLAIANSAQATPPSPTPTQHQRMLIRNANLNLQVADIKSGMDKINQLVHAHHGYIVSSSLIKNSNNNYSADLRLRVPSSALDQTLCQIKSLSSQVFSEEINGEDISKQYSDLESQLKNLMLSKIQLEQFMKNAKSTQDVLQVYQQLSNTQMQMDQINGEIKYYKESVDYSLVTLNITTKNKVKEQEPSAWEINKVAREAYDDLRSQFQQSTYLLIHFIIASLPLLLLWLLLFSLVFWLVKRIVAMFR